MIDERVTGLNETYKRHDVTFTSGRGATLFDEGGKAYIDLLGGIAVAGVGHAHPTVARAIAAQASTLMGVSNLFYTQPMIDLAADLHSLTGMHSFFCNSGAEAIECAIKLARRWGAKKPGSPTRIVAAEGSFHGRTMAALSATGQPAKAAPFAPLLPGFDHVPFGDMGALEAALDDDVVAVLLEPIQGEAGVVVPPPDYLSAVRSLCDEAGVLLILDEIQTGLGRTGKWFAHEHYGVAPDILCLAKSLGAGLPIGACLATDVVAEAFQPGDHASTFGGNPVACAAALAVLGVMRSSSLVDRSAEGGEYLARRLAEAFPDAVEIRGKGMMVGVELDRPVAAEVVAEALAAGVVINNTSPTTLRFVPPLVISDEQIDEATEILGEVWRSMTAPVG